MTSRLVILPVVASAEAKDMGRRLMSVTKDLGTTQSILAERHVFEEEKIHISYRHLIKGS